MKYIRHKTLGILAFEVRHNHKKLAQWLNIPEEDIESAGFVVSTDLTGPHLKCAGSSVSLNKHPGERDTNILNANVRTAEVCGA